MATADAAGRLIAACASGPAQLVVHLETHEPRQWPALEPYVHDALRRAVGTFPEVTPNLAAAVTRRVSERLGGAVNIAVTLMEAVIRAAAGEARADEDVPPNMSAVYALLVVGQLVHEGRLTVDEALGTRTTASD
ncbi:hypothetical protein [Jiangella endophytica]|uniref:hypothetical protein n=1 Tax=Jiangella endophytica TaxID=1623398 RepID=UPI000E348B6E|nr:hypothetical protein [Jiangella endophytica]